MPVEKSGKGGVNKIGKLAVTASKPKRDDGRMKGLLPRSIFSHHFHSPLKFAGAGVPVVR